jgi:hypothetical protein
VRSGDTISIEDSEGSLNHCPDSDSLGVSEKINTSEYSVSILDLRQHHSVRAHPRAHEQVSHRFDITYTSSAGKRVYPHGHYLPAKPTELELLQDIGSCLQPAATLTTH